MIKGGKQINDEINHVHDFDGGETMLDAVELYIAVTGNIFRNRNAMGM